jgi:hypothetical protein
VRFRSDSYEVPGRTGKAGLPASYPVQCEIKLGLLGILSVRSYGLYVVPGWMT